MSQIGICLDRIIRKQNEIGHSHFSKALRPPANPNDLRTVEKQLNLTFNQELIDLYSYADGEEGDTTIAKGKTGLIPIHNFMNLEMALDCYEMPSPASLFTTWDSNYTPGPNMFPFLTDGAGNFYWVDLNEGQYFGKIYWTNTYPCSPGYEYESLTAMFAAILEGYENGVFYLDTESYLNCDYAAFKELSIKYKPTL